MSLLLDALKKAAEQKAAKTRKEESEEDSTKQISGDDSTGQAAASDGDSDDSIILRHQLEDETELDQSELDTRLERTLGGNEEGTGTGIGAPDDVTQTQTRSLSEQMQTGEDETIIFAEEDATVTSGDTTYSEQAPRSQEDETELTRGPLREDETELTQGTLREDETELTQGPLREDETELTQRPRPEDETEFTQGTPREDETEHTQHATRLDETESGIPAPGDDQTEHQTAQLRGVAGEETDSGRAQQGEDDTLASDDDMSLLLVEREQTQLTSPTSITDPQEPHDARQALKARTPSTGDSRPAENTRNRIPDEGTAGGPAENTQTTRSSDTATTGVSSSTQTTRATLARSDSTATHTYAPDNYDRTLMRLPNDDASRLFAGMKSDSDVVMTPDYAKQVFRSKSSVQRMQHYKFYSGIAIVILLAISVYGVFEYQAESESIDTSLRPLKYDPMPGIIRPANDDQQAAQLIAGGEVDDRTLEIIQSAQNPDQQTSAGEDAVAEQAPPEQAAEAAAVETAEQVQPLPEATGAEATATAEPGEAAEPEPPTSGIIASAGTPASEAGAADSRASSLEIKTGKRIEEKQLLLREAYDAYQSGNDTLALERYNQVLKLDPGSRNALLARAAIHVQNGNAPAAIEDYQALLLNNPKDSLAMASLIAVANYSPSETETQLKLMIRDEPESPYLNFALANAYGAQNRWQEAQGHYYLALQNNPDDPNYAYNLAVSLEHISQPQAAISYYRRALENYNKGLATFSREVVDRRLEKLAQP